KEEKIITVYSLDLDILYFFNRTLASPWMDGAMSYITDLRHWVPVYVAVIVFLIIKFKWRGVRMVIACAILMGITDYLGFHVIKELFARPRPCSLIGDPSGLYSWIRTPDGIRLGYGFPS